MAEIRFPLSGRHARRDENASAPPDPLDHMAVHIRDLDEAAKRAATRINEAAEGLHDGDAAASSIHADLLAGLASALVERTEEIRSDCDRLSALMDRTAKLIAHRASHEATKPTGPANPAPAEDVPAPPAKPLTVAPTAGVGPDPSPGDPVAEAAIGLSKPGWLSSRNEVPSAPGSTSEGVRLIAGQMAIAGSSRTEIERRLRIQFGVSDADQALDDIFGSRRNGVG